MNDGPITREELNAATQVLAGRTLRRARWSRVIGWDRGAARLRVVHADGSTGLVHALDVWDTRASGLPLTARRLSCWDWPIHSNG